MDSHSQNITTSPTTAGARNDRAPSISFQHTLKLFREKEVECMQQHSQRSIASPKESPLLTPRTPRGSVMTPRSKHLIVPEAPAVSSSTSTVQDSASSISVAEALSAKPTMEADVVEVTGSPPTAILPASSRKMFPTSSKVAIEATQDGKDVTSAETAGDSNNKSAADDKDKEIEEDDLHVKKQDRPKESPQLTPRSPRGIVITPRSNHVIVPEAPAVSSSTSQVQDSASAIDVSDALSVKPTTGPDALVAMGPPPTANLHAACSRVRFPSTSNIVIEPGQDKQDVSSPETEGDNNNKSATDDKTERVKDKRANRVRRKLAKKDSVTYDVTLYNLAAHNLENLEDETEEDDLNVKRQNRSNRRHSAPKNRRQSVFNKATQRSTTSPVNLGIISSLLSKFTIGGAKQHVTRGTLLPPPKGNNKDAAIKPVKIFVGSWNCEYQELPLNVLVSVDEKEEGAVLRQETIYASVRQLHTLGSVEISESCLQGNDEEWQRSHSNEWDDEDLGEEDAGPQDQGRRGIVRLGTRKLERVSASQEPLKDWIGPGYDVYVISLQETNSDRLYAAIGFYLRRIHKGKEFTRIAFAEDRISGYGDGALLTMKSTTIACWVQKDLLQKNGPVQVEASKAMSFSALNGSKGAVSFLLTILNQRICFIGCHMAAGGPEARRAGIRTVCERLSEMYTGLPNIPIADVFHHLVWTGDFNFRLHGISAADALQLLEDNKIDDLFEHDELRYKGFGQDFVDMGFAEDRITFIPTYKKKDGRPLLDRSEKGWTQKEFKTKFAVKWYKGGHTEDRCPAVSRPYKYKVMKEYLMNTYEGILDEYI
eukprot:GHVQ01005098.1.p1 GENE.GHVQ01005098.1~~GHVQ01005098.1.p1  ORF type:complete len:823 (+),score=127.95 GHVQ01005098.1:221-2689(+)